MLSMYTVGYQGESIDTFVQKLKDKGINTLIDVRENPFSRKPGFSKTKLAIALENRGINYKHFKELGTPIPLRNFLKNTNDYKIFFDKYRDYLSSFEESLNDLVEIGLERKVCIMCFEKDFEQCHRKVIAEMLSEYLGKIVHVVHI